MHKRLEYRRLVDTVVRLARQRSLVGQRIARKRSRGESPVTLNRQWTALNKACLTAVLAALRAGVPSEDLTLFTHQNEWA